MTNNNDNVIDFKTKKSMDDTKPAPVPSNFTFHFFPEAVEDQGEAVEVTGFLKFGPQFIAVTAGPDDSAPVVFACQASTLKYVKRLGDDSEVQGTLSL